MNIKQIINKKSLGKNLTKAEIEFFVNGYINGEIPDYQASALLMAIKINGMNEKETFYLTDAMLHSGEIIDLSDVGYCVDKHSTGGISDSTTICLVPICAAVGVKMLKLSGRSLGFTGGTIDKLEAFDGYNASININDAKNLVRENGACVISASQNLAPADKKIYALRDITATVESFPLIASSVMSKKLASGAAAIVLDVKYGNGAFMKTKKDACCLAKLMVKIGKLAGKKMDYVISDMNQPLGYNVGSKLELYEAIEMLSGKKGGLYDSVIDLASRCISLGLNIPLKNAIEKATLAVNDGSALEKLKAMVKAQGGSTKLFKGLDIKPKYVIYSPSSGILSAINSGEIGTIVGRLGGSRQNLDSLVDLNAGVKTFHKIGDKISVGDKLFEVFANSKTTAKSFEKELLSCYKIKDCN